MSKMVPVSEAKARLSELIRDADSEEILLVRHSRPAAVLVSYNSWDAMIRELEDAEDRLSVYESRESEDFRVPLEKLGIELGLE